MDDIDYVCPLCCEELDISDREFYPCKCGYQVCMWCWHRIRESETGLCPACRTPYGEDPHQFSAVDVEEVLKANKEKEAAAKRERERQRQQQQQLHHHHSTDSATVHSDAEHFRDSHSAHHHSNIATAIEIPKDRTLLANMRVIRRNLVYAVGLPQSIATEETLRKPEYFGQYGKIAKMVLNRTQTAAAAGAAAAATAADARRASASAYVTFAHKEDTLACILALDGFYMDGRNIRASYGTSKYCSAFIKNVRCNNPDCTYLHEMGAPEDTFTKQEIQAGYVTSGRDVLARQQQILAEQMRQANMNAGNGAISRKKTGGGGPSGTGKASTNPVFPPPEFEEPAQNKNVHPPVPAPAGGVLRSSTVGTNANPSTGPAIVASSKIGRSSSVGPLASAAGAVAGNVPVSTTTASAAPPTVAAVAAGTARKSTTSNNPLHETATTAASVVAAGLHHSMQKPDSTPSLTPLTPLKRASKTRSSSFGLSAPSQPANQVSSSSSASDLAAVEKLVPLKNGAAANKKPNGAAIGGDKAIGMIQSSLDEQPVFPSSLDESKLVRVASIGGDVIGPPLTSRTNIIGIQNGNDPFGPSMDVLGGRPIDLSAASSVSSVGSGGSTRSSALGGEVYSGPLPQISKSAIGSGIDKWNAGSGSSSTLPQPIGGSPIPSPIGSLWGSETSTASQYQQRQSLAPGPSNVGSVIGSHISSNQPIGPGNSSSALASILGINLPTGSGSLATSTNLWTAAAPAGPSPLSSLNGSSIPMQGGVIGGYGGNFHGGSSQIGGVPIGGGSVAASSFHSSNDRNKSDIALLQSLLPGVHITSGTEAFGFGGFGGNGGWGAGTGQSPHHSFQQQYQQQYQQQQYHQHHLNQGLGPSALNGDALGGWGGGMHSAPGSSIGAIGGGSKNLQQDQRQGPGIW